MTAQLLTVADPLGARVRAMLGQGNVGLVFKVSEIFDFGGLGGPGGFGDPPERRGASPPTFLKGFLGPRGRPDPPNDLLYVAGLWLG